MSYRKIESPEAVVLTPPQTPEATVIWLHGLGADGHDFVPIVPELRLSGALPKFIFPHAPVRPVTINNGYPMRAWYDIAGLSLSSKEDEQGIRASESLILDCVQRELDAGIPANRIVIAGFSQGGAMALHVSLRMKRRLAGVLALSTYLPLRDSLRTQASAENRDVPIMMCHGRDDAVVPMSLGAMSRDVLQSLGYDVDWSDYQMGHEVCLEEINDIAEWLTARVSA